MAKILPYNSVNCKSSPYANTAGSWEVTTSFSAITDLIGQISLGSGVLLLARYIVGAGQGQNTTKRALFTGCLEAFLDCELRKLLWMLPDGTE